MDYIITRGGELYHYGVKGMKWGVRRYQNSDGSLTAAGKKRARQEYKADNKTAYELGKKATVYGHAAAKSMKRTIKYENKLDKRFEKEHDRKFSKATKKLSKKWLASAKTTEALVESYTTYKNKAEQHCKSLINKYGQEAVSSIKYKNMKLPKGEQSPERFETINERTNNLSDYAKAGAKTIASMAATTAFGLPIGVIFSPTTTGEKARYLEQQMYYETRKSNRRG